MPRNPETHLYILKGEKTAIAPFSYCERIPDLERRKKEKADYKKGYEIRISLQDKKESEIMKAILKKRGIISGNPYKKHKRIILPLYGEDNADVFMAVVEKA